MNRKLAYLVFFLLAFGMAGCTFKYSHFMDEDASFRSMLGKSYYTASNMHIYRARSESDGSGKNEKLINSVNYQYGSVLPWGTHVTVKRVKSTTVYLVADDGSEYGYVMHGRTLKIAKPSEHLSRFLSPEIEPLKAAYDGLSPLDKEGVALAKPLPGMSKRGVLMAIGYPPEFMGFDAMSLDRWTYWDSINSRFILYFEGDVLKSVFN